MFGSGTSMPSLADWAHSAGATVPSQMPDTWFVVFHTKTKRSWLRWISFGRFKHVSCFGWVPSADRWIFFDPALERNWLRLVPDDVASMEPLHIFDLKAGYYGGDIGEMQRAGVIVAVKVQTDKVFTANVRPGPGCVRNVARLIGIHTWAVRPDAFFRSCMRLGGQVISRPGEAQR